MNKEKEVDVIDSREVEVDLMEKVEDLTNFCKKRENLIVRMKIKARLGGKMEIPIEVVLDPIEEEVILTLEVDFKENVKFKTKGHDYEGVY